MQWPTIYSAVVPAQAGTHNPRTIERSVLGSPLSRGRRKRLPGLFDIVKLIVPRVEPLRARRYGEATAGCGLLRLRLALGRRFGGRRGLRARRLLLLLGEAH